MTFATFPGDFLNIFTLLFSSEFCSENMNLHPDFQASASRGTLAFQVERVTCNTRASIEMDGRCCMNFSCSCLITENINLKVLWFMFVINIAKENTK
jgi:hypothetical protein